MYSQLPADIRHGHPYFMYEEIRAQPEAVARSLDIARERGAEIVGALARARRVFVTGCGTSFYAAQLGAHFLQAFSQGRIEARSLQAFELVNYLPGLRPDDVVIALSHSGGTTMTLRALERARRSGCDTVVVTGFPESEAARRARFVLPTGYAHERSWAHTVSYSAAAAGLLALANDLAEPSERLDLAPLPAVIADALDLEEIARRLAATAAVAAAEQPLRMVVAGGGPNAVTAHEAALKLLETSYISASAFELEQMLHGPLAAVTPDTLLLVIAPPGRSVDRAVELARSAEQIGVTPVVLVGEADAARFESAHRLTLPDVPEVISPFAAVVPLQLFSYHLSVASGLNPDLIHRDDDRYLAASAQYQ